MCLGGNIVGIVLKRDGILTVEKGCLYDGRAGIGQSIIQLIIYREISGETDTRQNDTRGITVHNKTIQRKTTQHLR